MHLNEYAPVSKKNAYNLRTTMKISTVTLLMFTLIGMITLSAFSAGGKKKPKRQKVVIVDGEVIRIPRIEIDLSELESGLRELERELGNIDEIRIDKKELRQLERELAKLEDLRITIPDIDVDIPDIDIQLPHISFEGLDIHPFDHINDDDLSEDTQIRLEALREIADKDAPTAVPVLEKSLKKDKHPIVRYQAIRYLGRFIDRDARVIDILGEVIRNDASLKNRKAAIRILGRSDDPRAVTILENLSMSRD